MCIYDNNDVIFHIIETIANAAYMHITHQVYTHDREKFKDKMIETYTRTRSLSHTHTQRKRERGLEDGKHQKVPCSLFSQNVEINVNVPSSQPVMRVPLNEVMKVT